MKAHLLGPGPCFNVGIIFQGPCFVEGSIDVEESSFLSESLYREVQFLCITDVDEVFCCS